jgi:predicted metal-dependent hydrolase
VSGETPDGVRAGPAQPDAIGERQPRASLTPRLRARLARHPPGTPYASCDDPPPAGLRKGIAEFNQREYFACHETLEALWIAEPGPARTLYKGILQVGVGCYHLLRHNYRGASLKLQSGTEYLAAFAPRCIGVDVARLIREARALHAAMLALGPEHFDQIDLTLLPQVHLDVPQGDS